MSNKNRGIGFCWDSLCGNNSNITAQLLSIILISGLVNNYTQSAGHYKLSVDARMSQTTGTRGERVLK